MLSTYALRTAFFASIAILMASFPAAADVVITIDKSTQRMTIAVDGLNRWKWPVSTGARGYDTPNGSYIPFRMEKDYFSKEWDDAPMPNSIFFTQRGHAIHGSHDKHLGKPVSHGCVRLSPGNAARLFSLVQSEGVTNTKVVVAGRINSTERLPFTRRARHLVASCPAYLGPTSRFAKDVLLAALDKPQ